MVLDANIIIAYLSGEEEVVNILSDWKKEGRALFVSAVAESEVLSFPNFTPKEKTITEWFLDSLIFIPVDRNLARLAAGIRRQYKIKFPDAAIAATALFTSTPIVTRNVRDFNKIKELKILTI